MNIPLGSHAGIEHIFKPDGNINHYNPDGGIPQATQRLGEDHIRQLLFESTERSGVASLYIVDWYRYKPD